jgi:hypothetical protein
MNHSPRSEPLAELRILWVIRMLWFLFCVQMIKVSIELIETVIRRKELVLVP